VFTCQCRADKIRTVDDETHEALVAGHLLDALRLVLAALDLVDVPRETTLDQLRALEEARQALEASTVMLLLQAGVTWEAMARQLGVTRQSLHRRLSRKSTDLQNRPRRMDWIEYEWTMKVLPTLEGGFKELRSLPLRRTVRGALRKD
jgi:hypothetical protein